MSDCPMFDKIKAVKDRPLDADKFFRKPLKEAIKMLPEGYLVSLDTWSGTKLTYIVKDIPADSLMNTKTKEYKAIKPYIDMPVKGLSQIFDPETKRLKKVATFQVDAFR